MRKDSGYLSILLGIGMLATVMIGMGGIAYSFYRAEVVEEKEESLDMANDDSPFEQLKREKNIVITPVPKEQGGSRAMDLTEEGIPTGTYSNPPTSVTAPDEVYSAEVNRPNSISEDTISSEADYSSSSSFNSSSLIKPLQNDDFLAGSREQSNNFLKTPALTESTLGEGL